MTGRAASAAEASALSPLFTRPLRHSPTSAGMCCSCSPMHARRSSVAWPICTATASSARTSSSGSPRAAMGASRAPNRLARGRWTDPPFVQVQRLRGRPQGDRPAVRDRQARDGRRRRCRPLVAPRAQPGAATVEPWHPGRHAADSARRMLADGRQVHPPPLPDLRPFVHAPCHPVAHMDATFGRQPAVRQGPRGGDAGPWPAPAAWRRCRAPALARPSSS